VLCRHWRVSPVTHFGALGHRFCLWSTLSPQIRVPHTWLLQDSQCPNRSVTCPNRCADKPMPPGISSPGGDYHEVKDGGIRVKVSELEDHLANQCPERIVECPYQCKQPGDMPTEMRARLVEEHTRRQCPHRPVDCKDCHQSIKFCEVEQHLADECAERLLKCNVVCQYGCGVACGAVDIKARLMPEHHQLHCIGGHEEHCPMRPVPCRICGEMVSMCKRLEHETHLCPERIVRCARGCGEKMPAKHSEHHFAVGCKLRSVGCARCGEQMKAAEIEQHVQSRCAELCTLGCGTIVPFGQMTTHHRSGDCSEYYVQCGYNCGAKFPRDAVARHEAEECPFRVVPGWVQQYAKDSCSKHNPQMSPTINQVVERSNDSISLKEHRVSNRSPYRVQTKCS
jgi:hypothetical protein